MRRIYFAFLCFFLALSPLFADNEEKVHLKENGNSKVTVSKGNIFDFTVEMSDQDENRTVAISISLQNYGSTESIFIFLDKYSENVLKSNNPRMVYDKSFPGTKGGRFTAYPKPRLSGINNRGDGMFYVFEPGSDKKTLYSDIHMKNGEQRTFTIPFFYAKKKKFLFWEWYVLIEESVNELDVTVELVPDVRYQELSMEIDNMAHRVAKDTIHFCKHSGAAHYPSVEEQHAAWRNRIDSLRRIVTLELENRNASEESVVGKDFAKLQKRISEINLDNIPQVEHKIQNTCDCPARIRYMNLEKIFNKLDDYYQQLYNKKVDKEDIIRDVRALKQHSTHIQRDPKGYKKGINRIYNEIVSN